MKPRWPLLSAFLIFILFASVSASVVTIKADPVNNVISWNGTAIYKVTVTNNMQETGTFDLRSPVISWGDFIFSKTDVTLSPGKSEEVSLNVKPPKDVGVGAYSLEITARSKTDYAAVDSEYIKVYINSELPKLEPTFEGLPSKITAETIPFKLKLQNTGSSAVSGITGRLESDLGFGPHEFDIGSFGLDEERIVFSKDIVLDTTQLSTGNYRVKLILYKNGEEIDRYTRYISLGAGNNVNIDQEYNAGLLTKEYVVTIKNLGNSEVNDIWTAEFASWSKYFLSGTPDPSQIKVEDGKVLLSWDYEVGPGALFLISYKISYLPLAFILVLVILLLYGTFWYLRQDFTLIKELMTASDKKGKLLKVKLRIRNNTNKRQQSVIVIDSVPLPLKVIKHFDLIEPKHVKRKGNSTYMNWKFDEMDPGEERVLTYSLKSVIGVIGIITLPAARLKCRIKGKPRAYESSKLSLRSEHLKHSKEEDHKHKEHHKKHEEHKHHKK